MAELPLGKRNETPAVGGILIHNGIRGTLFSDPVLEAAEAVARLPKPDCSEGEVVDIFTIDTSSAVDLDDGFSCRVVDDKMLEFSIHIANVAHYCVEGGAIDREARRRGINLVSNSMSRKMFPDEFRRLCSLKEGFIRRAVTVKLMTTNSYNILSHTVCRSVVQNKVKLTHETAYERLKSVDPADEVAEALRRFYEFARVLSTRNSKPGPDEMGDVVQTMMEQYNMIVADDISTSSRIKCFLLLDGQSSQIVACDKRTDLRGLRHRAFHNRIYTKSTSPIRRYIDVVSQRLLLVAHGLAPLTEELADIQLMKQLADDLNRSEARVDKAESELKAVESEGPPAKKAKKGRLNRVWSWICSLWPWGTG